MIMTPEHEAGGQGVGEADVAGRDVLQQRRRDERQREEAVDDRRDAGQQLDGRLEDLAGAPRGVLGEVHGGAEPERHGHEQGDRR